jgi:phosphatidylinositol-3-phosphatase
VWAVAAAAAMVAAACVGCSASVPPPIGTPPSGKSSTGPPPRGGFSRAIVIVMENKDFGDVIGNARAPFLNSLADRYGLALDYHAIRHPSLPNYLALLGGSTFGIDSNCTGCHIDAPTLVDGMEHAGISWKAYMEAAPSACFKGAVAGRYAKKHNPFMYFDSIAGDPVRCSKVVPFDELERDLADDRLPRFVWITPDLCHGMHDCGIGEGDRFLKGLVPNLLPTLRPDGALFLTWDEGSSQGQKDGGRIATIVVGPRVPKGFRSSARYTHYSLLHTIEESWGLPSVIRTSCACSLSLRAFFRSGA